MEQLQAELKGVKAKWGKEIELAKAEKGAPGFPFPVSVTRYTPQPPSASMWDVEELPVRLVIHSVERGSPADIDVTVEVDPTLPSHLPDEIESRIEAEWRKALNKDPNSWAVDSTLEWVENKFGELLRAVPSLVDNYEGCDDEGATCRRYVLVHPEGAQYEEEEDDGVDEEEQQRRAAEYIARESERLMAQAAEKDKEAEEKRKLAEAGLGEFKAVQKSKKELAAEHLSRKEKSGHRWRKTGAKANKHELTDEQKAKKKKGGLVS